MDEVGFYYHPELAAARIKDEWRVLRWRVISSLFVVAIAFGIWLAQPEQTQDFVIWIAALSGISIAVYAVIALVRIIKTKHDIQQMKQPLALGLNRNGMAMDGLWFYWNQVGELRYRPRSGAGADRLELTTREGNHFWAPIEYTRTTPASVAQAVRILSSNLARVDLSRLDV
ncbi:MAG: hypothetical protein LBR21_10885 [Propionibacteriaceae bacterium]|jgi:hypothetical protein|nr:hypothetical protein [Propionibacteriaceae bacterium]